MAKINRRFGVAGRGCVSTSYISKILTEQELLGTETHSDVGEWHDRQSPFDGTIHTVPGYGDHHQFSMNCWCHPVESKDTVGLIMHNVSH